MAERRIAPSLVLNAARAFALVSFADGRLSPLEEVRFLNFARTEKRLAATDPELRSAWAKATVEVETSRSFGGPLLAMRTEVTDAEDKQVLMRAAQTALVSDAKLELQENVAIRSLAEALSLDAEKY